jgi:predicted MFS family arabinose efflux permease
MVPAIIVAEKRGKMKAIMLLAIILILVGQLSLAELPHTLGWVAAVLLIYFTGFNIMEASQPSMVSKLAPGARTGAAMGVYNTTQALGLFSGGALGGWLLKSQGQGAIFLTCSGLVVAWLIIAAAMKQPPRKAGQASDAQTTGPA